MISAIIITRNEENNIERTLYSLNDKRITEIIVSDSNSSDNTAERVHNVSIADNRIKFSSYQNPPFTAARGRNEGAKLTSNNSKYYLFLDGDMQLLPNFIDVALKHLEQDNNLAAIAGQMHNYYYDNESIFSKKELNIFDIDKNKAGGGMIIKSNEFLEIGGYSRSLIVHEEAELVYRLNKINKKFLRINHEMIIHHTELPITKKRIKERLQDKKIGALSLNIIKSTKDIGYLKILINDNFYTFLCLAAVLLFVPLSFASSFYYLYGITLPYFYISIKKKNFRVPVNYYIYSIFIISGILNEIYKKNMKL